MTTAVDTGKTRVAETERDEKLVNAFFVLYRNARIMEPANKAFVKQCAHFLELLQPGLKADAEVAIKAVRGRYFTNERFVRFSDPSGAAAAVTADWEALGIGGVRFLPEVTEDHLRGFFSFMAALTPRGRSLAELQEELDRHIPATVFLLALPDENEDDEDEAERRRQLRLQARTTFFRAVSAVSELLARTAVERDVNLAKTRRVVHALIDHLSKDKDSLVELSAIKDFDDYTYAHSVNVSVYSLTLGIRLGLDRPRLSQLGFAALFHDAGKVRLDRDLINKPDSFDENDWIQMQMHPALGAKTILRSMKLDQHTARAARGAFEHHINADYTGYPLLHDIRPLNLYSQIITIADTFDALTSDRVYFRKAMAPDQVIRKMRFQMTAKFNPILIALFNEVMGIYPAGSMALLSTDEIAVIMAANAELYDRPYVQIVGNREGLLPEPEWVDLARADQINRRIVRLIDPERYGLKVRDFILSGPE